MEHSYRFHDCVWISVLKDMSGIRDIPTYGAKEKKHHRQAPVIDAGTVPVDRPGNTGALDVYKSPRQG
ncbi:hypothetical protein ACJMK2_019954 [Sinanodonta woodiana]|uniref:Uncharacterized protein n=1 Tax=Sinanodonta woodiana TaxID=1069815 RepID=A0ABD3TYG4_SINWO